MTDDASDPYGRYRQMELYTGGMLADRRPDYPIAFEELRAAAEETLDPEAYAYVAGGAGAERTARNNRTAFDRWRIVPRMLRDVAERDLSVELFGDRLSVPFLLAPVGALSIVHEAADSGVARAAAGLDVPFVQSTQASTPLEDVADEMRSTPAWFQLYWSSDRAITRSLVERAERAGYDALVVTLDTHHLGWRERDLKRGYFPFLDGEGLANYFTDPAFRDGLDRPPEEDENAAVMHFVDQFADPSLTWGDLEWLAGVTDLPILLKGIVHPEDARLAADHADGIVVSTHGGRQVDNAVGALDALPGVVDAVDGRVPVLFDSGIRRGADVVVALALGADAVLLGRPYVYGLALGGEAGVRAVVENLRADVDLTLALAGCRAVTDLDRGNLTRAPRAGSPSDRSRG
jgi:isopentenyl-diphosphate delta-isomerase